MWDSKPTVFVEAEQMHCGSFCLLCLCLLPIPVNTDNEVNEILRLLNCDGFAAIALFRSCHLTARIDFSPADSQPCQAFESCLPGGGEQGSRGLSTGRNCLCRESNRALRSGPCSGSSTSAGHTEPVASSLSTRALKGPSALGLLDRSNHSVGQTSQAPLSPLLN